MYETLDKRAPPRYNEEERRPQSGDVQADSHVAEKNMEGMLLRCRSPLNPNASNQGPILCRIAPIKRNWTAYRSRITSSPQAWGACCQSSQIRQLSSACSTLAAGPATGSLNWRKPRRPAPAWWE